MLVPVIRKKNEFGWLQAYIKLVMSARLHKVLYYLVTDGKALLFFKYKYHHQINKNMVCACQQPMMLCAYVLTW